MIEPAFLGLTGLKKNYSTSALYNIKVRSNPSENYQELGDVAPWSESVPFTLNDERRAFKDESLEIETSFKDMHVKMRSLRFKAEGEGFSPITQ